MRRMPPWAMARAAGAAAMLLALFGCASNERIVDRMLDANRVQAQATDQQLLLNIVRAASGEPLHFSRLGVIRLPVIDSAWPTLKIPFGNNTHNPYEASGSLAAPAVTVEVTPQDSQKFMQGITQPVPATVLGHYLDQGWPRRLVLGMFVESMSLREGGRVVARFDGHPANPDRLLAFWRLIDALAEAEPAIETGAGPEAPFGSGSVPASAAQALAELAIQSKLPLQLDEVVGQPERVRATLRPMRPVLKLGQPDRFWRQVQELADDRLRPAVQRLSGPMAGAARDTAAVGESVPAPGLVITLRSAESMVYRLGELAAARWRGEAIASDRLAPMLPCWTPPQCESVARHAAELALGGIVVDPPAGSALLEVRHRASVYGVPGPGSGDRTMKAISLVSQLLQLSNEGATAPTTVRLLAP